MTRLPLPNGLVRATLADAMGRVVDEVTAENAFLSQYAAYFAKALAGNLGAITLPISHLAVAPAGVTIETFEAIAGWTGTPTLDTSSYRQGLASFSRAATASTQAVLTSPTVALDLAIDEREHLVVKRAEHGNVALGGAHDTGALFRDVVEFSYFDPISHCVYPQTNAEWRMRSAE